MIYPEGAKVKILFDNTNWFNKIATIVETRLDKNCCWIKHDNTYTFDKLTGEKRNNGLEALFNVCYLELIDNDWDD